MHGAINIKIENIYFIAKYISCTSLNKQQFIPEWGIDVLLVTLEFNS